MITYMSETRSRSGLLEASQMFCNWPVVLEQADLPYVPLEGAATGTLNGHI